MRRPELKWASEEEEALRGAVAKHGVGEWKNIQRDPEFNSILFARSTIDLKDKWRNLIIAKSLNLAEAPATPLQIAHNSAWIAETSQDSSTDAIMTDSSSLPLSSPSKLNAMIYEALSTLKQPNGSDSCAIASFIEGTQEVPLNFKRVLQSRLRRLVQQDKLEMVHNCYRIKRDRVEEGASSAAYEAEKKSFLATETVKEEETISTMAEDRESSNLIHIVVKKMGMVEH